jgi:hypothetical protein
MSLLNNIVEFPSDAFKIVTHFRHPLPQRTDTIGPWLDCLSFLAWLSALTNSALVYFFRTHAGTTTVPATDHGPAAPPGLGHVEIERARMYEVLGRALFIALAASHGYIVLRAAVRHVLERALWFGSPEKARLDAAAREVKERYLESVEDADALGVVAGVTASPTPTPGHSPRPSVSGLPFGFGLGLGVGAGASGSGSAGAGADSITLKIPVPPSSTEGLAPPQLSITPSSPLTMAPPPGEFWQFDEGLDEIRKSIKEA